VLVRCPRLPLKGAKGLTKATWQRSKPISIHGEESDSVLLEVCCKKAVRKNPRRAPSSQQGGDQGQDVGEEERCCSNGGKDRLTNTWGWGFRLCPGSRRRRQLDARWVFKMQVRFVVACCCIPSLLSQHWCCSRVGWASELGRARGPPLVLWRIGLSCVARRTDCAI
jgi:hypothetical protein